MIPTFDPFISESRETPGESYSLNFNSIGFSFFVFMGGGALSRLVYLPRGLLLSQSFLNKIL